MFANSINCQSEEFANQCQLPILTVFKCIWIYLRHSREINSYLYSFVINLNLNICAFHCEINCLTHLPVRVVREDLVELWLIWSVLISRLHSILLFCIYFKSSDCVFNGSMINGLFGLASYASLSVSYKIYKYSEGIRIRLCVCVFQFLNWNMN